MTQLETTNQAPVPVPAEKKAAAEEKPVDRYLEGGKYFFHFDLLEQRNTKDMANDADAKNYFEAKKTFQKGYELCLNIPSSLEDDVLEKHEEDIKTAAETMVASWLQEDRAAPISERVLILGQQYEKVLLKNIPESEKEGFYVKSSLLFSAWILLAGKQHSHCKTTLDLAIDTYGDELPARVYFLRANCNLNLEDVDSYLADLKICLEKDETFILAYHNLGSIYLSLGKPKDAIENFNTYLEKGRSEHSDTIETLNSLYSLSVLHSKETDVSKKYYEDALKAEERFKELYGVETGMSKVKRDAIKLHGSPEMKKKVIMEEASQNRDPKMEQLIQSGILNAARLPPTQAHCYTCRKTNLKDDPSKPLMCCGGCGNIWYCSRDCQKQDFRAHKVECKKRKTPHTTA